MSRRGGKGYDYRKDYFERNKGLFNTGLYFCSYCGKPITKKRSHVDHIIPQSKSERIFNRSYNTTISCPTCNQKKSDKIDYRVIQGYTSKVFGGFISGITGTLVRIIMLPLNLILWIFPIFFRTLGFMVTSTLGLIFGLLMKPIIIVALIIIALMAFGK